MVPSFIRDKMVIEGCHHCREQRDHRHQLSSQKISLRPKKVVISCSNQNGKIPLGPVDVESVKIVWINHTSRPDEMWISRRLLNEAAAKEDLKVIGNEHE